MDRDRARVLQSRGGKAAHHVGTAHEWTSEEARIAAQRSVAARRIKAATAKAAVEAA